MPIDSPQVSRTTSEFSETMSDDEFAAYLKKKGLKEKDYSILIGNITCSISYAQSWFHNVHVISVSHGLRWSEW